VYMARRRFFVDRIEDGRASLQGQDAHHLARVLRAEPGQRYEITDGAALCLAEIESIEPRRIVLRVVEALDPGASPPSIAIVAALIKFDRFEWMIEKVTELGVRSIIPVESARSDQGLFKAAAKRVERWRKIARESSQQSRRLQAPEIRDPVRLRDALREPVELRIRLEEDPGAPPLFDRAKAWNGESGVGLAVGPEGGWTDGERAAMEDSGWLAASLGGTVLRAETAAIAAAAVLSQFAALSTKQRCIDKITTE
jgi:16S rRNA (uracil1498-N3)-methyltransferase